MVGFNRRFASATQSVKDFFAGMNEPLSVWIRVNAGYLSPDHWLHDPQIGGGRVLGEGCHFVDLLLYLAASQPVEVYARALPDAGKYRQDNVSIQIRFADGSIGAILYLANGEKRLGKEYIEISGGGSMAIIHDFRRWVLASHGKVRRHGHWWSRQDKGHRAEMRAFVDSIRMWTGSPITFEEAYLSAITTLKVLESLRTGKPVSIE